MKKLNGYITVYLSLIVGLLLALTMTLIEGVRRQTLRFETECVMDAGLNSIFAEYHREMVKQYGLLFIDDSYGQRGNVNNTKSHILEYMNMNFRANDLKKDLTALHADNCLLGDISFASDDKGTVLRYQIVRYMKSKNGTELITHEGFDPNEMGGMIDKYDEYEEKRESLAGDIDGMVDDYNAGLPEGEEAVGISNPADAVEGLSSSNALYYACGDMNGLSVSFSDINSLISKRNYPEGCGLYEGQESPYGPINEVLYMTYLFDKLGYKGKQKDGACLNYQIEYIIKGNDSDIKNLEEIAESIFRIRYVTNISHLYSSPSKNGEAMEAALAATAIIGQPELADAVKHSILLAWAYAESAKDMRILFDGHKLSMVKTDSDWNTPLSQIVDFKSHLNEYHIPAGTMDYKDYLYGFLVLEDNEKCNMRLMDIMEMDIRMTPGNSNFMMNDQIYQLRATVNVSSGFGYGYEITRGFSYR